MEYKNIIEILFGGAKWFKRESDLKRHWKYQDNAEGRMSKKKGTKKPKGY